MASRWTAAFFVAAILGALAVSLALAKPTRTITRTIVQTRQTPFDGYQQSMRKFLRPTLHRPYAIPVLKDKYECFQYGDNNTYRWMVIACTIKGIPVGS